MRDPKITFFPIGRLGNVMFQAAACIGYAKQHNVGWGVPLDTREVPRFREFFPGLPVCNEQFRTYKEHPEQWCSIHNSHKDACHFNYHEIPFNDRGVRLMGFFQSWKYFENAKEEVREAFKLPHVPGYENCVSVHVRRGDYVQHAGSFPPVSKEYILNAMQSFLNKHPFQKFVIMSDDIAWCRDNIKLWMFDSGKTDAELALNKALLDAMLEFSEGRNEYEDLCLMASCGHHIIANSTFSWWGAYLGHNPERVVVSPSHKRPHWFGPTSGVKQDCVDLIPDNWIQIEWNQ